MRIFTLAVAAALLFATPAAQAADKYATNNRVKIH